MSISNPSSAGAKNPIRIFVQFKGKEGTWRFHDASTKVEQVLNCEIEGIVLDGNISKITGYNKALNQVIRSNYFRNINEEIKVWMGKDLLCTGTYKDENTKNKIKANSGKFSVVLPIVTKSGSLIGVELKGALMSEYFNYRKEVNVDVDPYIRIHSPYKVHNDSLDVDYYLAKFSKASEDGFTKEVWNKAMEHDVAFQLYMGTPSVQALPATQAASAEEPVQTPNEMANQFLKDTMGGTTGEPEILPPSQSDNDEIDDLPF